MTNDAPPKPGDLFTHYQGTMYEVHSVDHDANDWGTLRVGYHNVAEPNVRISMPLSEFYSNVDKDGYSGPLFSFLGRTKRPDYELIMMRLMEAVNDKEGYDFSYQPDMDEFGISREAWEFVCHTYGTRYDKQTHDWKV